VTEIVARTDGIPLFIEEMTKAAIEAGTGQAARETIAACAWRGAGNPCHPARFADGAT
jgi:predicted ATPase